jgi:hypothetical protein
MDGTAAHVSQQNSLRIACRQDAATAVFAREISGETVHHAARA